MGWSSKPMHRFVGRKACRCLTKNIKNAWFSIDLQNVSTKPTNYTLKHVGRFLSTFINDYINWTPIQKMKMMNL